MYRVYDENRNGERRLIGVYSRLSEASAACYRAVWAAVIVSR